MEKVCEELNEIKAENKILRAENRSKFELVEILKRVQNEQLTRIQETSLIVEKKDQELNSSQMEVSRMRQLNEDLERSLCQKSLIIKHLSSENNKLRADGEEKFQNCEEENRRLLFALEEANKKKIDLEQEIGFCRTEIEVLKNHLSASQKKLMEAANDSKSLKEIKERNDMLMRSEEEKIHLEQKLKWKKEQFGHLEEAHEKIKNQFKASKKVWEQEKVILLDEISCLQTKLESQTRILIDVQKKLQMCNNALAHEETRRKNLEAQVSEFKTRFDEVSTEHDDAKWNSNSSAATSDNEVAGLRHSLSTKEIYLKEIEYQKQKLEQENIELLASVKELQEATINGSGNSSLAKSKTRLRSTEPSHKNCNASFRAKEGEWSSKMKEMTEKLNQNRLLLETKEAELKEIEMELECSQSSLIRSKLENELISIVLSSTIFEERSNLLKIEDEMIMLQNESSETNKIIQELRGALNSATSYSAEQHEKNKTLKKNVESFDQTGEDRVKELEELKKKLAEVTMALKMASFERKRLEASLLAQVEFAENIRHEKDELFCKLEAISSTGMEKMEETFIRVTAEKLQKEVKFLENELISRELEAAVSEHIEAENRLEIEKEKDMMLEDFRKEVEFLENELIRRELEAAVFEHITLEKRFEIEKENLVLDFKTSLSDVKEQNDKLQKEMRTLDDLLSSNSSSEKENLLRFADEFISKLLEEERKLMGDLGKMIKSSEEFSGSTKENFDMIGLTRTSDGGVVSNLSAEKETLLLSLAKEFEDYISGLCEEDIKLMGDLEKMMKSGEEFLDSTKENLDMDASLQAFRKQDIVSGRRSPFRRLN